MTGWIGVSLPFATFALIVDRGVVTDAAPIARYTVGWEARRADEYFTRRGARVRCFPEAQAKSPGASAVHC